MQGRMKSEERHKLASTRGNPGAKPTENPRLLTPEVGRLDVFVHYFYLFIYKNCSPLLSAFIRATEAANRHDKITLYVAVESADLWRPNMIFEGRF